MNYYWLIQNLIKEYARGYRDDGGGCDHRDQTLDAFFKQLRDAVDGDIETLTLQERMESYSEADNWDQPAEG